MTYIVMLVAGAGVGMLMMDIFVTYRRDMNKGRQQLEAESPYDHALSNAVSEQSRLLDELSTLRALKRTETDNERLRNEIETIAHEDGEEATESVYGGLSGIPIVQHSDGTISPITRDNRISTGETADNISKAFAKAYGTNVREDDAEDERLAEDDVERSLINDIKDKASENLELAVEFAKMTVQDEDAIRKQLEETSKEITEEIRDARRRVREFREEGKYYGETLH